VEFRVLGRLEVEVDGVDVTPARPKQRTLLALLLLRAGEVVPADELVEALWGERPPETAQTALHGHISALRKRLGADRIETRPPGYSLRLADEDEVDVRRFERLVAEARADGPVARSEKLSEALELFRGEPLADFRYEEFARGEGDRLEEMRAAVLEEQIESDLALGRHREAIPQLERLVADHPLRERLRAQLMLALYRAGRQADALAVFKEARSLLVSELGIEPSPALQRLERQILNQDPELAALDLFTPVSRGPDATKPSGIVTFAFVEPVADEQVELVRTATQEHGGFEVEAPNRSTFVAFARARDAVAFAVAIQRSEKFRIGIDSAEATPTETGYVGMGIRGAASLCAAAHRGQILLSQPTRALLREAQLGTADVRDLGEHRLKDLAPARRLFQLLAPGLETEFPPARGLETLSTNLPLQPTPLVGREHEIRKVMDLLSRPDVRLVTLTGAGGAGKTRLAVQVAAELLDDFADGVFFVDLAPLADPDLVLPTVARTLGVRETSDETLTALADRMRDRPVLLVLDNFEHLLEAAPAVAKIGAAAPPMKALVTSRAPLRLSAERIYPVSPLETPDGADDVDRILQFDSVALFASRARAIRPEFAVTAGNARSVAEICKALDGLPLAIELAATRVGVLPPAALRKRLDHRLKVLKGRTRAAPERQRTLRATIDWSYDLLEPEEQRLFLQLAVFAGGCTLEAAESVCRDDLDVVDGLASLIDASLVRLEGTDENPRFAMLETIRHYASKRLEESGEAEELGRRHVEHFLALAEEAEPNLRGSPGDWLDRLEKEHDNLRAALDRLEAAGESELALRLAGALWRFWYLRGYLTEGRRRLESALEADEGPTAVRAKALNGAAVMAVNTGDPATARLRAKEGLVLHRKLGDAWGTAYSTFMLGAAVGNEGDLARAQQLNEESVRRFRELGDEHSALLAARNLASTYAGLGDGERARALHEDNLRRARATGNERIEASTLGALAMIAVGEGRVEDAFSMLTASLRIHHDLGDLLDTAVDLCRLAFVLAFEGRAATAARLLSSFEAAGEKIGARRSGVAEMNEETLTTIRTQLDEAAFAKAWEQDQALTVDEAIALALDSRD